MLVWQEGNNLKVIKREFSDPAKRRRAYAQHGLIRWDICVRLRQQWKLVWLILLIGYSLAACCLAACIAVVLAALCIAQLLL